MGTQRALESYTAHSQISGTTIALTFGLLIGTCVICWKIYWAVMESNGDETD